MAICKFCGVPFSWGRHDDRWVPLVPIGDEAEEGLVRDYVDNDGVLRASHRQICTMIGGPTVTIRKLHTPIQPGDMIGPPKPQKSGRRRRREDPHESDGDIPFGAGR